MMPNDFPAWQTVYGHYRRWLEDGTREQLNLRLGKHIQERYGNRSEGMVVHWINRRLHLTAANQK